MCLDMCVMTETEETMCLENCDTSCLGEWSSSDVGPGAAKSQNQVEQVHQGRIEEILLAPRRQPI